MTPISHNVKTTERCSEWYWSYVQYTDLMENLWAIKPTQTLILPKIPPCQQCMDLFFVGISNVAQTDLDGGQFFVVLEDQSFPTITHRAMATVFHFHLSAVKMLTFLVLISFQSINGSHASQGKDIKMVLSEWLEVFWGNNVYVTVDTCTQIHKRLGIEIFPLVQSIQSI